MLSRIKWGVLIWIVFTFVPEARGAGLLSASQMSLPFRSVAASEDVYALHYNPAGLAFDTPAEFAFIHQFTESGPGGDNSLMLRAKALAVSINWIKNRGAGKRREYMIGTGHAISPQFAFGTTLSYMKADAPELNNKTVWTHSLLFMYSPTVSAGVRWENPWHTKINGESTVGMIVGGVSVRPPGVKLALHADWFYPDDSPPADSYLRGSAQVQVSHDIDFAGFVDTEGRFGIEFRLLRDRSAGGVEARGTDEDGYTDGSLYVSVLDRLYRPRRPAGVPREPRPLRR